ncbi:hypothetical protein K466DRAFT_492208 [Polyporus arcularius HHB13444]|uniref:SUZ domain-containing protein n=1 Tax=Polyporus arcularius HHB13444 TaxID=1314778 RepID=A0A5C3PBS0_9APHY|nr:hypothetical protein K466DRAFT_492208 [Polyporus arcularius HHB13444]
MATASGDAATASTSMSAPDIHSERSLSVSPIAASPSFNPSSSSSSLNTKLEASPGALHAMEASPTASMLSDVEPDAQILEALRSKDRIYVLKLGEQMEALIKERRPRIDLTPATSYQRLLVHRCSAYYKLVPETDQVTKTILVYCRSESRIPARRICELVPAEQAAQPAFQIMRRDRPLRGRQHSQPGSTAGEDADTSDVDASEAGSVGGVSSAASSGARRYKTIEEREAEYNQARSRIFMGFEEKKDKEKDMSANSSTFSLVSGSGSTSGGRGSSIGDMDDSASSAPTESEWSGPVNRDKRDARRGAGSTASSVRSLRSSGASYNANGSGSSRNSRATSPSFTYPTLYEPASGPSYEQGQYGTPAPPPPGYIAHYVYPSYNTPTGQPYMTPYYYPPYHYPPPPSQHSDPATPGNPETMYPPPQSAPQPQYGQPYMWSNSASPGQPPPPHQQHQPQQGMPPPRSDGHTPAHPMPPSMQNVPPYPPYAPGPAPYGYGMPGYYQQPYQSGAPTMGPPPPPPPPPSSMPGQMYHPGPVHDTNANNGNAMDGYNISRTSSRNSNGHGSLNGKRGGPRARGAWNYTPGVSSGGFPYAPNGASNSIGASDAYGPRLSTNMRRTSGASSGGSAGARTPADETSSTASSSTTSSSSRRTFTSTSTSSKHPLPARPDWAVGLKPQHSRHHDHNAANRTLSPARMGGGQSHLPSQGQPSLQPNDFPPLSSAAQTRPPVVGGAWTNGSLSRVMVASPQGAANASGTALVHYPTSQQSSPQVPTAPAPAAIGRLDEQDPAYERPPPKNPELFNPKAGRNGASVGAAQNGRSRANTGASPAELIDGMGSLGLADAEGSFNESFMAATASLSPTSTQPVIMVAAGETAAALS